VIAVTAHAMLGDRERFLDCGMSDYVAKPIEEEQLLGVLSRWIDVGRAGVSPAGPPASSPALPQVLPGLNVGDGVRRASGNTDLYRRLVAELRRDFDSALPRLRAAIDAASTGEAHDILHTLKGTAATMGARRVADQAAMLEASLRRGETLDLDPLANAIDEARRSIDEVTKALTAKSAAAAPPPLAGPELLPIARRMREHLDANNLAAMDCFDELKTLAGSRWSDSLRELEASLDRLDFATARAQLETIESQLGVEMS